MGGIQYFFINVTGQQVAPNVQPDDYEACGDEDRAGPFLSAGSAIEWRDQFCPAGKIEWGFTNDPGVCTTDPISNQNGSWVR